MDYKKIHDQIINRAKDRELNEYSENHHIIPKCLGGTDDPGNLVRLTAREHFIIHWLLTLVYPYENPLKFAFWNMCQRGHSSQMRYVPSSRIYEWARLQLKGIPKPNGFQVGEGNTFYGKQHSDDSKLKISKSLKGREFSEEHRKKLSESAKKRKGNKPCKFKGMKYEDYLDSEKISQIKQKIKEAAKKPMPEKTKQKLRDNGGKLVIIDGIKYKSISEARRITGLSYNKVITYLGNI